MTSQLNGEPIAGVVYRISSGDLMIGKEPINYKMMYANKTFLFAEVIGTYTLNGAIWCNVVVYHGYVTRTEKGHTLGSMNLPAVRLEHR